MASKASIATISLVSVVGGSGGSSASSMLVGNIDENTTAFPTARPNGSELVLGDYVAVKSTATVPFTLGGIEFTSTRDKAVWTGIEWLLNANPFQKTNETPLEDKSKESIGGTSKYQSEVNKEVKDTLTYKHTQSTGATMWDIVHNLNRYPSIRCVDSSGNEMIGEVIYVNENEIRIKFSEAESGFGYLS